MQATKPSLQSGDATLYGDMAGGFDVLKDVYKTQVYELANYRNRLEETPVIPEHLINRPETNTPLHILDDYEKLDKILSLYIDEDFGFDAIIEAGFDKDIVKRVLTMVDRNEYKRRTSPHRHKNQPKSLCQRPPLSACQSLVTGNAKNLTKNDKIGLQP